MISEESMRRLKAIVQNHKLGMPMNVRIDVNTLTELIATYEYYGSPPWYK